MLSVISILLLGPLLRYHSNPIHTTHTPATLIKCDAHKHTLTCMQAYTHIPTHTRTQKDTHTLTPTDTHTDTLPFPSFPFLPIVTKAGAVPELIPSVHA